ncbi:hypothetical protein GOP47_0025579 [Adiantum capillus-veneris]|uniref:HVA22-like protein n=1 Tax=Adiantum capillus-veneris TaxID=13818 RepID=A0A9D4Z326_ADICA|nr:hypothetical protein GOP47_0025579 [Adiantum capillus-veneris]
MALLSSSLAGEVGIRLLFSPLGSRVFARWACIVGGIGFPVYSSFKAIESKEKSEQEQWLCYWTAYGCFTSLETFSDKILSWFPGYYHAKLLFLIWLQLPLSGGARYILTSYLSPFLHKYEGLLDRIVNGTRTDINTFFTLHLQEVKLLKTLLCRLAQRVFTVATEVYRSLRSADIQTSSVTEVAEFVEIVSEHEEESSSGLPVSDGCL